MDLQEEPLLPKKIHSASASSPSGWNCCCGRSSPTRTNWSNIDLTARQSTALNHLKHSIREETYDKENAEHTELWKELWSLLHLDPYPGPIGEHWVGVGFQQKDPSSDLRGSQLSGLRHLINFVQTDPDYCKSVLLEFPLFPFCVAGLNVSHCLFYHLLLYEKAAVPPYGQLSSTNSRFIIKKGGDRPDLIRFVTMLDTLGSDQTMQRLYNCAFRAVIDAWYTLRAGSTKSSDLDLLKFNSQVLPDGWKQVELSLLER